MKTVIIALFLCIVFGIAATYLPMRWLYPFGFTAGTTVALLSRWSSE